MISLSNEHLQQVACWKIYLLNVKLLLDQRNNEAWFLKKAYSVVPTPIALLLDHVPQVQPHYSLILIFSDFLKPSCLAGEKGGPADLWFMVDWVAPTGCSSQLGMMLLGTDNVQSLPTFFLHESLFFMKPLICLKPEEIYYPTHFWCPVQYSYNTAHWT